jgi:nitrite reductase/ring-hydroxylating ferredoxin subunit
LPDYDLPAGVPRRVTLGTHAILLYREDDEIHAIGAVCAHAGGPLEQGEFYDGCVQCPLHDSVYDLRTGKVVHGPSTYSQPHYEVRVADGMIEVRAAEAQEADAGKFRWADVRRAAERVRS